jgi:hypothetical protein
MQEAVRIARSLGLGWSSKLADVGVPREEALATWWTLLLMDELIAWGVYFRARARDKRLTASSSE